MSKATENLISDEEFGKALKEIITDVATRYDEQRQKEQPWKDLFAASEHGLSQLLSEAHHQTSAIILDLGGVIEKKFGIKVSSKLYALLKAIPFAYSDLGLRGHIVETDSDSCCADKTRFIYYQEVLAEINRIKGQCDVR